VAIKPVQLPGMNTDSAPAGKRAADFAAVARRPFLYFLGWCGFRFIYATYFGCRYYNPERVPRVGPAIIASNHLSFIDPPLVGCGLQRGINFLARESLFRFPVIGWVLHRWQAVPVDREGGGAKGLKMILDRLLTGGAIIMFPEGTRSRDGSTLAQASGCRSSNPPPRLFPPVSLARSKPLAAMFVFPGPSIASPSNTANRCSSPPCVPKPKPAQNNGSRKSTSRSLTRSWLKSPASNLVLTKKPSRSFSDPKS
jgi:1-acyl-sn-glycerol-3-phosphate acyltransferase